jgi:hypothetical protein
MATTIYLILTATQGTPTRQQWENVLTEARTGTFVTALRLAARMVGNELLKPGDRKFDATLNNLCFGVIISDELTAADIPASDQRAALKALYLAAGGTLENIEDLTVRDVLVTILDDEANQAGITGNLTARFQGVVQAELRDAAQRAGFTPTQASRLQVTQVFTSAADLRAWLAVNWNYPVLT